MGSPKTLHLFSSVILCSSYVEMFLPNNLFKCYSLFLICQMFLPNYLLKSYSLFLICQNVFTKLPFQV